MSKSIRVIAVVTGDVENSSRWPDRAVWAERLKAVFAACEGRAMLGRGDWALFRGDSFQVQLRAPEHAFWLTLLIRAALRSVPAPVANRLDARTAIGIGPSGEEGREVTESDGPAHRDSGRLLDSLKAQNRRVALQSPWEEVDAEMSVSLLLADILISGWSQKSAEVAYRYLLKEQTQAQLAELLHISQPAVNRHVRRLHLRELLLLEERFRTLVNNRISDARTD